MLRRIWADDHVRWLHRDDDVSVAFADRTCALGLAGVTGGTDADLAANTTTALDALVAARATGVGRVLLFSSAAIYGRNPGALTEDTAPTPDAPYGTAKAAMEAAVLDWSARHPDGPEAVILRLGNVAGADALLSRLTDAPPDLDMFPGGHGPRRSYIGPITLAATLATLARAPMPLPAIMNVAAPGAVDMADLLRAAGRDWTSVLPRPGAIATVDLETSRLQSIAPLDRDTADPSRIVAEWRAVTP
ncbi:NAD-dependent epimerase/dehydratase family protein [Jannaschia donghaensis]|uniref:UDP-glucose 4-epimerase n=1 Tax=Jannaschia donghaensis TaxID=420998 RepID=A0A0M6YI11_9RHOB|nr:NAD-dependent epimerase/dehydratase family protein [Jannaschia donghaensis]CTQ49419.1 UDP-glucose 4-epimerase [Jannaschia donghaensis]